MRTNKQNNKNKHLINRPGVPTRSRFTQQMVIQRKNRDYVLILADRSRQCANVVDWFATFLPYVTSISLSNRRWRRVYVVVFALYLHFSSHDCFVGRVAHYRASKSPSGTWRCVWSHEPRGVPVLDHAMNLALPVFDDAINITVPALHDVTCAKKQTSKQTICNCNLISAFPSST